MLSDLTRDGDRAPADAGDAAAARLRNAHPRRAHALARAPPRREALVGLDRPALGRCRHRQRPGRWSRPSPRRRSSRCASSRSGSAPAHSTRRRCSRSRSAPAASYAEARSAAELASIYEELGTQLAGEYLVRYRSAARPMSQVDVRIEVAGAGEAATAYVAPTPSLLRAVPPLAGLDVSPLGRARRSLLALFFGLLVCVLLLLLSRGARGRLSSTASRASRGGPRRSRLDECRGGRAARGTRNRYAGGWWAQLERDLELARMTVTPRAGRRHRRSAGTFAIFVLALIALGAAPRPLRADDAADRPRDHPPEGQGGSGRVRRSVPRQPAGARVGAARRPQLQRRARRRRRPRQRAGPGRARARAAGRPARRPPGGRDPEARAADGRTATSSRSRCSPSCSGRPAATRPRSSTPSSRTIRERAEIRRLVRTLTAQGRMARWILTALPIFLTGFLWLVHPDVMTNFFTSGGGQVALVIGGDDGRGRLGPHPENRRHRRLGALNDPHPDHRSLARRRLGRRSFCARSRSRARSGGGRSTRSRSTASARRRRLRGGRR